MKPKTTRMKRLIGMRTRSRIWGMEQDIHKLADWLVKVTHEGIAIEHKILEWKAAEKQTKENPGYAVPQSKAS
jgi:hypothetical protein